FKVDVPAVDTHRPKSALGLSSPVSASINPGNITVNINPIHIIHPPPSSSSASTSTANQPLLSTSIANNNNNKGNASALLTEIQGLSQLPPAVMEVEIAPPSRGGSAGSETPTGTARGGQPGVRIGVGAGQTKGGQAVMVVTAGLQNMTVDGQGGSSTGQQSQGKQSRRKVTPTSAGSNGGPPPRPTIVTNPSPGGYDSSGSGVGVGHPSLQQWHHHPHPQQHDQFHQQQQQPGQHNTMMRHATPEILSPTPTTQYHFAAASSNILAYTSGHRSSSPSGSAEVEYGTGSSGSHEESSGLFVPSSSSAPMSDLLNPVTTMGGSVLTSSQPLPRYGFGHGYGTITTAAGTFTDFPTPPPTSPPAFITPQQVPIPEGLPEGYVPYGYNMPATTNTSTFATSTFTNGNSGGGVSGAAGSHVGSFGALTGANSISGGGGGGPGGSGSGSGSGSGIGSVPLV
ncbi:hypothetical protein HK102_010119, partial [Quaeritorhiza haematococci]